MSIRVLWLLMPDELQSILPSENRPSLAEEDLRKANEARRKGLTCLLWTSIDQTVFREGSDFGRMEWQMC